MSPREKAAENCTKLRTYLEAMGASGAGLPKKLDGSVNLRAIALGAGIEPQVLSVSGNPAAREMVLGAAAKAGMTAPGQNQEIADEAISALRKILDEMSHGARCIPLQDGVLDIHSLAQEVGFKASVLFQPEGHALLAAFASANHVGLPRFASPAEVARGDARARESRHAESIGRALALAEAENSKLLRDLASARAENATLRRRIAHGVENGVGL